jgi:hypothetical protein
VFLLPQLGYNRPTVTGFIISIYVFLLPQLWHKWLSHRSGNRQPKTYVEPEAAITVFELLMMGGASPETC